MAWIKLEQQQQQLLRMIGAELEISRPTFSPSIDDSERIRALNCDELLRNNQQVGREGRLMNKRYDTTTIVGASKLGAHNENSQVLF